MNENVQLKQKYDALGAEFERVHFSADSEQEKLEQYEEIAKQMSELRKADSIVSQNYLTDLIHIICRKTCLKDKNGWIFITEKKIKKRKLLMRYDSNNQESC